MRVTQSMLASTNLRYINQGYERLGKLQDQLTTGKKITRPSDDPVVAMKGMRYRSEVNEIGQFKRNLDEVYNWMENSDTTLDKVTQAMQRINELAVQGANDTYDSSQRNSIATEIEQVLAHIEALANTKVNNKYIFNGTDTTSKPVDITKFDIPVGDTTFASLSNEDHYIMFHDTNGKDIKLSYNPASVSPILEFTDGANKSITIDYTTPTSPVVTYDDSSDATAPAALDPKQYSINHKDGVSVNNNSVNIEVMKGIHLGVNIKPQSVFSAGLFKDVNNLIKELRTATTGDEIDDYLTKVQSRVDSLLKERSELGARFNRAEMIEERVKEHEVIAINIMSQNEDIDAERVIIDLKNQETVHRAALAAGARIIQPTLMDFLR
ncbi:flagellar hook-associated protein FlgL [Bacillus salitolerans]|uniref:Flagellar hook-associated protein FlgL n=1 Tax=Bacillus salitolerans TaxID=1437434 RepID=A0ABW4LNQ9_9BACI